MKPTEFVKRAETVLRGYGWKSRFARCLEVHPQQISRALASKKVPRYWEYLLELLENCPPEQWPQRWKEAMPQWAK